MQPYDWAHFMLSNKYDQIAISLDANVFDRIYVKITLVIIEILEFWNNSHKVILLSNYYTYYCKTGLKRHLKELGM